MRKISFIIPLVVGLVLITALILAIIPAKISRENSAEINATVSRVTEGGMHDIVISLRGVGGVFYISQGIKRGLIVDDLSGKLLNNKVTLLYMKPRVLGKLSPQMGPLQITELKSGNELIFSEFNK